MSDYPKEVRDIVKRFLETEGPIVGTDEIVEIGDTGLAALRDANGDLTIVPAEAIAVAGEYLPMVISSLKNRDTHDGFLDQLNELVITKIISGKRKAKAAAKSSRSKYPPDMKEQARRAATDIWTRRPALSGSAVADLVADDLRHDFSDIADTRTIRRWISDLKPE